LVGCLLEGFPGFEAEGVGLGVFVFGGLGLWGGELGPVDDEGFAFCLGGFEGEVFCLVGDPLGDLGGSVCSDLLVAVGVGALGPGLERGGWNPVALLLEPGMGLALVSTAEGELGEAAFDVFFCVGPLGDGGFTPRGNGRDC
jgi:hypothetical protein